MKKHTPPQRHTRILYLPIEPHEAVAEVSKGKAYIIQKKVAPLENVCVCVTCFNPSHFAQPFLDTLLSDMSAGCSRRSQNRTTCDLYLYLGLRRLSPQRHATIVETLGQKYCKMSPCLYNNSTQSKQSAKTYDSC